MLRFAHIVYLCGASAVVSSTLGCGGGAEDIIAASTTNASTPPRALAAAPFAMARTVAVDATGRGTFENEHFSGDDVDVWDIGALSTGTRVIVDVTAHGIDLSAGFFDDTFQVLMLNHDRFHKKNVDPYAIVDIREDTGSLFIVLAAADIARNGSYKATVTVTRDLIIQSTQQQHVVLNFAGGKNIAIGSTPAQDLEPFDAAVLSTAWVGRTEEMKDIVRESMRRAYSGLGVVFHDAADVPQNVDVTWVHFGGKHPSNVGLAANVDYGNRYRTQAAIVYVGNFAKYVKYGYTSAEIAQGFANVAAHELGHLLGCNHSDDPADVMNVSPTVDALVAPQFFVPTAALDPKVFKAGLQDGANLVFLATGGDWLEVEEARARSASEYLAVVPERKPMYYSSLETGMAQQAAARHKASSRQLAPRMTCRRCTNGWTLK